jgi:hypothetical protein
LFAVLHIRLFKCYSNKDERQRIALGAHLWQIQRVGVIAACDDRKMTAGQELAGKISSDNRRERLHCDER